MRTAPELKPASSRWGAERRVHGDKGEQQSGQCTGEQQDPRLGQQLDEVAELACQGGLAGARRFGEQDEDRQTEGEEDDAAAGEEPAPGALVGQGLRQRPGR